MRLAVFTVSPNKQYLGMVKPTTPAQQGPKNKFAYPWKRKHFSDFPLFSVLIFHEKKETKYRNLCVSLCVAAMALQVSVLFWSVHFDAINLVPLLQFAQHDREYERVVHSQPYTHHLWFQPVISRDNGKMHTENYLSRFDKQCENCWISFPITL